MNLINSRIPVMAVADKPPVHVSQTIGLLLGAPRVIT